MDVRKNITIAKCLAGLVFAIGLLVLVGWYFDITILMSITPSMTAMNPITALLFMLSGTYMFLYHIRYKDNKPNFIQIAIGIVLLSAGLLKLLEIFDGLQIHFDRWLFLDKLSRRPQFNAIAPNTALLFLIAGILFLNVFNRREGARHANDALKIAGILIAYLSALGYLYSIEPAYRIGPFVPMALNTAFCFIALYFCMFLSLPKGDFSRVLGSPKTGGKIARAAVPLILFLPAIFGYLKLLGLRRGVFHSDMATAFYTGFTMLMLLFLVYYYARRLNLQDSSRARAERQTQESEEKYRSLVESLQEGVVYFDEEGYVVFCNDRYTKITGYSIDDLKGTRIINLIIPQENRADIAKKLKQRFVGVGDDYETELVHKSGHRIWISVTAKPIYDGESNIKGSFAAIRDITERKRYIQDIEAFTFSAAHDLKSPMARIHALGDLLLENSAHKLDEEEKMMLQTITSTTLESTQMLQDLLEFARLNASQLNKTQIDMNRMARETAERISYINPAAKIEIEDLPQATGDSKAVQQVWTNLIGNALKYSGKTSAPEIIVGIRVQEGKFIYYVKG